MSRYGNVVTWLSILLTVGLPWPSYAGAPASPPVRYVIVVTGGELLAGGYADGHTLFLTQTLRPLGLQCVGSMCVDDKRADLKDALRFATGKATLVIVTGGLGPTDNDITREALREFTGIALREHPDVLAQMTQRFRRPAAELRSNLRRQTQVPVQGTYLKNSSGTAVGLVFEMAGRTIVALPGPPRELQPMVRDELIPYLSRRLGTRLPGTSLTLRFVGLGQSQIDQTLKDHVPLPPEIITASQFEGGRVDFTFSLPEDTSADRARLQELKEKITEHLGDSIYADKAATSLEMHVLELLERRGATLSVAEVSSGGALAAALNGGDGAERVLVGSCVAPTEKRLLDLLNAESGGTRTAEQVAAAIAGITGSSWAISVGEVRRDPNGNPSTQVTFRLPDGSLESRQIRFYGHSDAARSRFVTQVLDRLRRRLREGSKNAD